MVRIGDLVAREVGVQKLARHTGEVRGASAVCPDCGQPGERLGEHAPRLDHPAGKGSSERSEVSLPEMPAAFFSLRRTDWELRPATTTRQRMYRRIVFAAAQGVSFGEAAESLSELGELTLLPKRVWRAAKRIGEEPRRGSSPGRGGVRATAVARAATKVRSNKCGPSGQRADGRRSLQLRERLAAELDTSETESNDDGFWARVQGGRAAEHEERSLRGRSLVRTSSRDVRRSGENAGNSLSERNQRVYQRFPGFDQGRRSSRTGLQREPRWPPGNIGQKRSGHERRRGCVWAVAGPARPTIAASTQLCGKAFLSPTARRQTGECVASLLLPLCARFSTSCMR